MTDKRVRIRGNAFLVAAICLATIAPVPIVGDGWAAAPVADDHRALSGDSAYGDWTTDSVGLRRHLTPADMPAPYATRAAANGPTIEHRPPNVLPRVPPGFKVEIYASGLKGARLLRAAPNGEVFVAESARGAIEILHPVKDGQTSPPTLYADGLDYPFGLAFFPPGPQPQYLYVGNMSSVIRYAYRLGDARPSGKAETIIPELPVGGHVTRDVVFSPDGRKMYVSVGSASNDAEGAADEGGRANVLEFDPDGKAGRRYGTGIRNPVGLTFHPLTGDLWTAVNERDGLGDNLPPDYVTRVRDGGFYGWPWYYIGNHWDPRHKGERPDLGANVTVPDVLIQPHSAPLHLAVYTGGQFPDEYRNDVFVALHGSWNRSKRTGYKVVRIVLHNGEPTGEYEDFMLGFVAPDGNVWGRPVGLTVASDGALLVSDDVANVVWRVSYAGKP